MPAPCLSYVEATAWSRLPARRHEKLRPAVFGLRLLLECRKTVEDGVRKEIKLLPIKEQIGDDIGLLRQLCPRAKPMMQHNLPSSWLHRGRV